MGSFIVSLYAFNSAPGKPLKLFTLLAAFVTPMMSLDRFLVLAILPGWHRIRRLIFAPS
jgi:hypothetical protein